MTSFSPLHISAGGQRSDILVGRGLLASVGAEVRRRSKSPAVVLVTDSTVGPLYGGGVRASLEAAGFRVIEHAFPAGETHKHLEALLPAFDTILSANIDRGTPLVALGGGVTGDMAGFLAATMLRGVPFVQVPTTLMAMVDSSIGGKTGVNHAAGKNLIGAFHQPMLVLSDPEALSSLPPAEVSNGLAECVKHDLIRDAAHFDKLATVIPAVLAGDVDARAALVHHNASIKAAVVNEDPFEKSVRAHLNLGHTFGHAIEIATDHAIAHGAAVAMGTVMAAKLSQRLGMIDETTVGRIVTTLQLAGLPTTSPGILADEMISIMARDKKVEAGKLRFVLLEGLGRATVRRDVPEAVVREILRN